MLGLVSQIAQVLMLRELLMVFHGNELTIGIILCFWLAWVGCGSFLGFLVIRKQGRAVLCFTLSSAALLLFLPWTIYLIRILRSFFSLAPGAWLSLGDTVLSCFLLMGPVCMLLGAQFIFLSRIWREKDGTTDVSGAAKTYMGEATGNMLGGLLFTLALVHLFSSMTTALMICLLMLFSAGLLTSGTAPYSGLLKKRHVFLFNLQDYVFSSAP